MQMYSWDLCNYQFVCRCFGVCGGDNVHARCMNVFVEREEVPLSCFPMLRGRAGEQGWPVTHKSQERIESNSSN